MPLPPSGPSQHSRPTAAAAAAAPAPAPQARNVAHVPWALVGTPLAAMVLYVMIALALVMAAVPSDEAATAPFG